MRLPIQTALLLVSTGLACAVPTEPTDPTDPTEIGFAEVRTLGTLNGQALACRQLDASSRAKTLMIGYAPKTRRYGIAFESATNAAFLAATRNGAPCPTEADLAARLAESATALQAVFPREAEAKGSDPIQAAPVQAEPPLSTDETGS
jgi:hypothetical protein